MMNEERIAMIDTKLKPASIRRRPPQSACLVTADIAALDETMRLDADRLCQLADADRQHAMRIDEEDAGSAMAEDMWDGQG
jgi:hypothetical protein